MQFRLKSVSPVRERTDCLVVGVHEHGRLTPAAQQVDKATGGLLSRLVRQGDLRGTVRQVSVFPAPAGIAASRLVVAGLGASGKPMTRLDATRTLTAIAGAVKGLPIRSLTLVLDDLDAGANAEAGHWLLREAVRVFDDATYRFEQYKSKASVRGKAPAGASPRLGTVTLGLAQGRPDGDARRVLAVAEAVVAGRRLARDLGNQPPNVCHPEYLAGQARALARGAGERMRTTILDERRIKALGMGAFMAVSQGSEQPGRLIALEWRGGRKGDRPWVFVGKGITFDTGGISLKPGAGMDEMKFDMCGAASVFGVMAAVAELALPVNVVGVVAAAENMPGGGASRPGDIVTTMSGQTVEILNTDAEGRLVLCDALTWVSRYKPRAVIDIATLTGACVVALGSHPHGLYSNDPTLASALLRAGEATSDRGWQMPLWEEYQEQLDSPFADMANIGGPKAGSVTAACFLARFAKDYRWAHLDIAGTAWHSGPANKGATGRPVPMLVQFLVDEIAAAG